VSFGLILKKEIKTMAEFASKGVAGSGLGLGIAGTALGLMNGGLGNFFGGWGNCSRDGVPINRYEAEQQARIAELETEVKLRDANVFTMGEMNNLRNYMDAKFSAIERELCDQRVYNATNTATIGCIANQVNTLMGLTKVVIPNGSICPGWGNVTVAPSTTG
jgi:hypothetical protein